MMGGCVLAAAGGCGTIGGLEGPRGGPTMLQLWWPHFNVPHFQSIPAKKEKKTENDG